jgi:hypothetical protein
METKIFYTESGKNAIDEYFEKQKKQFEARIIEEKYVLGDKEVEVTAYDVESYIKFEFNNKRMIEKKKRIMTTIELYIFFGILFILIGILYPILKEMMEYSPIRFILTTMGSILTLAGCFFWLYLYKKLKK